MREYHWRVGAGKGANHLPNMTSACGLCTPNRQSVLGHRRTCALVAHEHALLPLLPNHLATQQTNTTAQNTNPNPTACFHTDRNTCALVAHQHALRAHSAHVCSFTFHPIHTTSVCEINNPRQAGAPVRS